VTAPRDRQLIAGINWTNPSDIPRYRSTQVQPFDPNEIAERGGFWERQTATNTGGLRIITGAGIYRDRKDNNSRIPALQVDSFLLDLSNRKLDSGADLPTPDNRLRIAGQPIDKYTLVWSDMMPMTGGDEEIKKQEKAAPPNLRMRATAVYHYTQSTGVDQIPIACVSSYYDPTDETTAKNGKFGTNNGYPWGGGGNSLPYNYDERGRSNNGVVYEAPYTSNTERIREIGIYLTELRSQAKLMFPNGRIVNQPLQNALKKLTANVTLEDPDKPLSISDNAALDTAICAFKILDGTIIPVNNNPILPHGAIQEASFLDSREIKAINRDRITGANITTSNSGVNGDRNSPLYDLDIEQRQPLEIRVTDINLSTGEIQETYSDPKKEKIVGLTRKKIDPSQIDSDYLLPNSGIVYASRDDALRDDSSANDSTNRNADVVQSSTDTSAIARLESQLLSPTDFKLDPTRRPNGIRLINGSDLSRDIDNRYRPEEKGLILVSDLPVYIKGDFNLHQTPLGTRLEEFQETLDRSNWSNFYTRRLGNLTPNFACRPGKAGCPDRDGDTWRSATIIADAVTLLSNSFRDGFRNQGDYDLNKNTALPISQQTTPDNPQQPTTERDKVSQSRNNQGFWDNSFVTSSDWWDTNSSGNPYPNQKNSDDSYVGSYLTNGVTPIQRRTTFPEYVMEICRKIPVETCQEGDWKIGYDQGRDEKLDNTEMNSAINLSSPPDGGYKPDRLGAGTTARPALQPEDRRYPRRVAFQRNDNLNNQNQNQNRNQNNRQNNLNDRQNNQPSNLSDRQNNQQNNQQNNSNNQPSNPGNQQNNQQNNLNNQQSNPGNQQNNQQSDRQNNQQQNNQQNNQPNNQRQNNQVSANQLTPLGIDSQGNVKQFRYVDGNNNARPDGLPRQVPNALWFKTTNNPVDPTQGESYSPNNLLLIKEVSNGQPLLVPVLQIHSPDGFPSETLDRGNPNRYAINWLQTAEEDTTFNAVFMAGNSPSRPQEESAGLPNFVRFLENWENRVVNINGNFIQMRRSAYATAPFMPIRRDTAAELATADNLSWFDYAINKYPTGGANNDLPTGTPPYYSEPERHWQFDVALFSQSSDLFAQEFTTPSTSQPSELLREVSRDDPWVQTLLCTAIASDRTGKITATYTQYAILDKTQRPATCQNDTPDYPANLN
ncbi:MAG: hormogonium polysaccharide biosynthesis protein HpsA, partial [Chroococcidiopsis sp.]